MTANVDRAGCIGCGMCAQTAPEVFSLDEKNLAVSCGIVAPHNHDQAKQAAAECPVSVIHIDD